MNLFVLFKTTAKGRPPHEWGLEDLGDRKRYEGGPEMSILKFLLYPRGPTRHPTSRSSPAKKHVPSQHRNKIAFVIVWNRISKQNVS